MPSLCSSAFEEGEDYQLLELKQPATLARVINGDYLWMRSGPSTSHSTINRLARGTQLLVLSQEGEWTQVRLGEQIGYCMSYYLSTYSGETTTLLYGQDFLPEGDALKSVQQYMIELGYMKARPRANTTLRPSRR